MRRARSGLMAAIVVAVQLIVNGCSQLPGRAKAVPPAIDYAKCLDIQADGRCDVYTPSLGELIARPEVYDGKQVQVIGVLSFGFENNALFVSGDDRLYGNSRAAVWLDRKSACPECAAMNGKWVSVSGVYRPLEHGHMGLFAGTLSDITYTSPQPLLRGAPPFTPPPLPPRQ
jgi:hypothetical protein